MKMAPSGAMGHERVNCRKIAISPAILRQYQLVTIVKMGESRPASVAEFPHSNQCAKSE
jgi:hypothetical protein